MNIPEPMERYNSSSNLWADSNQDEKYLRHTKPSIMDIHSKQWHIYAHVSLLNETAINDKIDCYVRNESSPHCKGEYMKHTV